ncbi:MULTISPECIES: hypothetical protein [Allobacillus]|uniref:SdpI/YhfL protein family protein n=1 Tax=Allobacillus halotolerans TaxID=570278 RepID=A0ABS6GLM4_9BACI|nr:MULTISPECIES: hypothetical protein [Allobacillus]MBU6079993.1 hypothetical protein [Allobacillus halotolerans]
MRIFLFVVSYVVLDVISSLLYVGLLLLLFSTMKKIFNMNEEKWSALFKYRKGKGLYSIMVFPYLLMIAIMFPVSMLGFELINFDYRILGYIAVIMLPTLILLLNLPKLKESIVNKYAESY